MNLFNWFSDWWWPFKEIDYGIKSKFAYRGRTRRRRFRHGMGGTK